MKIRNNFKHTHIYIILASLLFGSAFASEPAPEVHIKPEDSDIEVQRKLSQIVPARTSKVEIEKELTAFEKIDSERRLNKKEANAVSNELIKRYMQNNLYTLEIAYHNEAKYPGLFVG